MGGIDELFEKNRVWAEGIKAVEPEFFRSLARQQAPEYLWIGCSDSRVAANQIVDLMPGEVFVHRNVANVVVHTDFNLLAVLQFAVEILRVRHIIVCGHYGCGGVRAAIQGSEHRLLDYWLQNIRDIYHRHQGELGKLDEEQRVDRLCELNVRHQVANVCHTTIVQEAWRSGQDLTVHGLIYSIRDGILRDLDISYDGVHQVPPVYRLVHERR